MTKCRKGRYRMSFFRDNNDEGYEETEQGNKYEVWVWRTSLRHVFDSPDNISNKEQGQ